EAGRAVPPLADRVMDPKEREEVRVASAMSLQTLGPCEPATKAIPRLVKVLDDPSQPTRVRERVLWALRVHGGDLATDEDVFRAMTKVLSEKALVNAGNGAGRSGKMLRYDSAFLISVFKGPEVPEEVFPVLEAFLKDSTIRIYTGLSIIRDGKAGEG